MDRGSWWAIVLGVVKELDTTQLLTTHAHVQTHASHTNNKEQEETLGDYECLWP